MSNKTRPELKAYFETGDKPTQSQFGDLIDSNVNKKDDGIDSTVIGTYPGETEARPLTVAELKEMLGIGEIGYHLRLESSDVRGDIDGLWRDSISTINKDNVLIQPGGFYEGSLITDTIVKSLDGGKTWVDFVGKLPFAMETPNVAKIGDWWYFAGNDAATNTQRKTVFRTKFELDEDDELIYEEMTDDAEYGVRYGSALIAIGLKLYLFGGQDAYGGTVFHSDCWVSDDFGATWTLLADNIDFDAYPFLAGIIYGSMAILGDYLYQVSAGANDAGNWEYTGRVFRCLLTSIVDATMTWEEVASLPLTEGLAYPRVAAFNNRLFCVSGGMQLSGLVSINTSIVPNSDHVFWYNPDIDEWFGSVNTGLANLCDGIEPTHATSLVVYGDKLLRVIGNESNKCYSINKGNISVQTNGVTRRGDRIGMNLDMNTGMVYHATRKQLGIGTRQTAAGDPVLKIHQERSDISTFQMSNKRGSVKAATFGFDDTMFYFEPVTAGMGIAMWNQAENAYLWIQPDGKALFHQKDKTNGSFYTIQVDGGVTTP